MRLSVERQAILEKSEIYKNAITVSEHLKDDFSSIDFFDFSNVVINAIYLGRVKRQLKFLLNCSPSVYTANFLFNAVVQEILTKNNDATKILYGDVDSRPMYMG